MDSGGYFFSNLLVFRVDKSLLFDGGLFISLSNNSKMILDSEYRKHTQLRV